MHKYTEEQIDYLREITWGRSNKEITSMFNKEFSLTISEKAIAAVRKRYKIKTGSTGQFEIGIKPWNKGRKGVSCGGKETQFKKGNVPPNRAQIGAERIDSKDGYIYVKVQDGYLNKNWKLKHVLIWEKVNGPVPDGHAVIFGDGNKLNFDINNLILVSRKQLLTLNRNNLIQNDADLTRTAVIITDLKHKISERKR